MGNDPNASSDPRHRVTVPLTNLIDASKPHPDQFGSYRTTGVLGRGGMGIVYEAEQEWPKRAVALKVISVGFMDERQRQRFKYEADVLARLEHPGIARVYEAGIAQTSLGPQPFFAMELVRGKRLDEYVKEKNPPLKARLQLLIDICQAVQHAHVKGVIHRDLKPSNILVTDDGKPKVLDFGVARAIDSDIQSATLHTETGQLVGTLPYMAPEQAAGKVNELDTTSDVYALGVVAYELLSGKMPYKLEGKPLHEAVRAICEEEPSRLSSIDRNLRGDVETIVQKALEKDKTRRYPTAGELAADVKRYLDYEPITARPPSTWYNLKKFARRNKTLVGGIAAVFLVLLAGTIGTTLGLIGQARAKFDAQRQAAVAEAVSQFQSDMLESADPDASLNADPNLLLGDKVTVLQVTQAAIKELESGKLKDQPLVEAAVRNTIGNTLRAIGRYDDAAPQLERALHVYRTELPAGHAKIAASIFDVASLRHSQGRLEEAEALFREALHMRRTAAPTGHRDLSASMAGLALLLREQGRFAEAEQLLRETLDYVRKSQPPGDPNIANSLDTLAGLLQDQGKLQEAEPHYREALEISRKALPAGHPIIATTLNNLAGLLKDQGRLDEAEPLYREALAMSRQTMPAGHPQIAMSLSNLASLLRAEGRVVEAEPLYREAIATSRQALPSEHFLIATQLNGLALLLQDQGNLSEAESMFREALNIRHKALPAGHPDIASSMNNLAVLLRHQDKLAESESLLRDALDMRRNVLPQDHPQIVQSLNNLAKVLLLQDKFAEAEVLAAELYARVQNLQGEARQIAVYLSLHGPCLVKLNRHTEAAEPLRVAYEKLKETNQQKHPQFKLVLESLVEVADTTNHRDDAARWRAELAALIAATQPSTAPASQPSTVPS